MCDAYNVCIYTINVLAAFYCMYNIHYEVLQTDTVYNFDIIKGALFRILCMAICKHALIINKTFKILFAVAMHIPLLPW